MALHDFMGVIALAAVAAVAIRYFSSRRQGTGSSAAAVSALLVVGFLCALLALAEQDSVRRAVAPRTGDRLCAPQAPRPVQRQGANACSVAAWFRLVYEAPPEPVAPELIGAGVGFDPADSDKEFEPAVVNRPAIRAASAPAPAGESSTAADYVALAQTDTVALLKLAMKKYEASVSDYAVTMTRRERSDEGKLGRREIVLCRFRQRPFSVFLKWEKGAGKIDRALYAPSLLGPQIHVHPTGLAGLFASVVKVDLDGKHAKVAKRIQNFGFGNTLSRLVARGTGAPGKNELSARFLGQTDVAGRPALAIEWRFPHKDPYPYGRVVVQLCAETLLPVAISMWNFQGQLQAAYTYSDLRVNVALTDDDFSPKACGLGG